MAVGIDTDAYRRNLPHLQKPGKTYFVTFCTAHRRPLPATARAIVLGAMIYGHRVRYWLEAAVVMPDHVHLILMPY